MADISYEVDSNGAYNVTGGVIQVNLPAQASVDSTSTLNGDSVTLYVYEDNDGDDVAENSDSFTLSGGSESFSASTFDLSSGNEVWYELDATDDGDVTTALSNIDVTLTY